MAEWINAKEKFPDLYAICLCCVIIPERGGGYSRMQKIIRFNGPKNGWECDGMIVTHWIPLPPLPEVNV